MPREFLQYVFRQQFQDHADRKIGLLQLVAFVDHICEIEVELPYMWKTNILGVEEGTEPRIVR